MFTFSELLKRIRNEAGLTQEEFAKILDVSTILITLVETDQKKVSKNLIERLAVKLGVHPSSLTPFVFIEKDMDVKNFSHIEKSLIVVGEKLQNYLIHTKSKRLKKYV